MNKEMDTLSAFIYINKALFTYCYTYVHIYTQTHTHIYVSHPKQHKQINHSLKKRHLIFNEHPHCAPPYTHTYT